MFRKSGRYRYEMQTIMIEESDGSSRLELKSKAGNDRTASQHDH